MFEIKPLQGEKQEIYPRILEQDKSLIEDEKDWLVNLANTSSLLYHFLDHVNWVGFYLYKEEHLYLDPYRENRLAPEFK